MVNNENPDRNSRDDTPEAPRNPNQPNEERTGIANPPMKGTDIPATTDLEYIDREKGKRTTM
jgi:hypothetical protein